MDSSCAEFKKFNRKIEKSKVMWVQTLPSKDTLKLHSLIKWYHKNLRPFNIESYFHTFLFTFDREFNF